MGEDWEKIKSEIIALAQKLGCKYSVEEFEDGGKRIVIRMRGKEKGK